MKRFLSRLAVFGIAAGITCALASCGKSTEKKTTTQAPVATTTAQGTTTQDQEVSTADYTSTYQIATDNDEGETVITAAARTPLTDHSLQAAYGNSFGSFVDDVTAKAELYLDGNTYTYKWYVQCGTEGENGYFPVYTFQGDVVYQSDVVIQISAPTYAEWEIMAYGQFATNEEQIGYFGAVGTKGTSKDTSCAATNLAVGDALLAKMSEGVFILNPSTKNIEAFAAGTVHATDYQISVDNDETGETEFVAAAGTPIEGGLNKSYATSFGSFVDQVTARGYVVTTDTEYAYVWECQCGTEGENGYFPVFAWWGNASSSDAGISAAAPTYAMEVVNAYGQFATNEEQIGYFGAVGTVSTSLDSTSPYSQVKCGDALLALFSTGTWNADYVYSYGEVTPDTPAEEVDTTFYGKDILNVDNTDKDDEGNLEEATNGFTNVNFTTRGYAKVVCSQYSMMNTNIAFTVADGDIVSTDQLTVTKNEDTVVITIVLNAQVTQYYVLTNAEYAQVVAGVAANKLSVNNTDKDEEGNFPAETTNFTEISFWTDGYAMVTCAAYESMNANYTWAVTDGALVISGAADSSVTVGDSQVVVMVKMNDYVTQYYLLTVEQYNNLIA